MYSASHGSVNNPTRWVSQVARLSRELSRLPVPLCGLVPLSQPARAGHRDKLAGQQPQALGLALQPLRLAPAYAQVLRSAANGCPVAE